CGFGDVSSSYDIKDAPFLYIFKKGFIASPSAQSKLDETKAGYNALLNSTTAGNPYGKRGSYPLRTLKASIANCMSAIFNWILGIGNQPVLTPSTASPVAELYGVNRKPETNRWPARLPF
ncbi:MAG: hypothetical protein ABH858_06795, partial [Candidatus Omnitrophota bacterium]